MKILWLAFEGTWHVLLAGLILGAGLPTLFALGVRSLSMGTRGDPARRPSLLGKVIAGLCFAVVLLAVLAGIATIVAHGLGVQPFFFRDSCTGEDADRATPYIRVSMYV